jgi:hypothetical protein
MNVGGAEFPYIQKPRYSADGRHRVQTPRATPIRAFARAIHFNQALAPRGV